MTKTHDVILVVGKSVGLCFGTELMNNEQI